MHALISLSKNEAAQGIIEQILYATPIFNIIILHFVQLWPKSFSGLLIWGPKTSMNIHEFVKFYRLIYSSKIYF